MDPRTLERALTAFHFLSAYHRYEVVGIENIPSHGPGIIVTNHSLGTYDGFLFAGAVYQRTGRICRVLGDRRIFQIPFLSQLATKLGMVQGTPAAAQGLLQEGHLLIISPGGMRESLRSRQKKHQIDWQDRMGFVRLSMKAQVPITLATCPQADNLYSVYENPLTPFVYRRFKLPLPIVRGLGLTFLPRPIELKHYVRPAITPPAERQIKNGAVTYFHQQIVGEMEKLIRFALTQHACST